MTQIDSTIDALLVEDSRTQAMLVEAVVARVDQLNLIATVSDGLEAIKYLRREGEFADARTPDIIFLDINMPRRNGFEVLTEMKADENLRRLPVVMLTTSSAEEDVVRSYEGGAVTFISKPVELPDLEQIFARFSEYWTRVARLPGKSS